MGRSECLERIAKVTVLSGRGIAIFEVLLHFMVRAATLRNGFMDDLRCPRVETFSFRQTETTAETPAPAPCLCLPSARSWPCQ